MLAVRRLDAQTVASTSAPHMDVTFSRDAVLGSRVMRPLGGAKGFAIVRFRRTISLAFSPS